MIKKDNDRVVTYDPKTGTYTNSSNTIKIKNVYDARAYNKLLNEDIIKCQNTIIKKQS